MLRGTSECVTLLDRNLVVGANEATELHYDGTLSFKGKIKVTVPLLCHMNEQQPT
jgi:hypothetical protein